MVSRPDNAELEMAISIALKTAPAYALRNAMSVHDKMNREIAVQTLTSRVVAALRLYVLAREPNSKEQGAGTLQLFRGR
jgi:hypothetical protein